MIVKLVGIAMLVMGVLYLAKPVIVKQMLDFFSKGQRLYWGGALNIIIGIIFMMSIAQARLPLIILIVGILSLIKGIAIIILGPVKVLALTKPLLEGAPSKLRVLGGVALAIGILLIYSV